MTRKNQTNCRRAFHWLTKAWYNRDRLMNEIRFGMYSRKVGTCGEMVMRWYNLYGNKMSPRLESFYDSWYELNQFRDVIEKLAAADDKAISEQEFVDILLSCGFEDITDYENPHDSSTSNLEKELSSLEHRAKIIREKIKNQQQEQTP